MIKINLGSGPKNIGGDYINIDAMEWEGKVDAICNLTKYPFEIKIKNHDKFQDDLWDLFEGEETKIIPSNIVDKIVMDEVLEHISFKETNNVLKEIYRILKKGGELSLQVPDCGKAMEYHVNNEICPCVPHKSVKGDSNGSFKADPNCSKCKGKGKIHPNRWLFSFTGAAKHQYDHHLSIFTYEILFNNLNHIGFSSFEIKNDEPGYKLKAKCIK